MWGKVSERGTWIRFWRPGQLSAMPCKKVLFPELMLPSTLRVTQLLLYSVAVEKYSAIICWCLRDLMPTFPCQNPSVLSYSSDVTYGSAVCSIVGEAGITLLHAVFNLATLVCTGIELRRAI
jgi:hypothetical protein